MDLEYVIWISKLSSSQTIQMLEVGKKVGARDLKGGELCNHPGIFKNLCIKCGKYLADGTGSVENNAGKSRDNAVGMKRLTIAGGQELLLSPEEASVVQSYKISTLTIQKKLALVLDLDHTLVHSVQIDGPAPPSQIISHGNSSINDIPPNDMQCYHLPIEEVVSSANGNGPNVKHLVMKKRPFLDRFLALCHSFCHMIVYTAGTRRYAEAVQRIIDPTRKYFSDRLVSRSDGAVAGTVQMDKSLEKIFLGDYSMAVIIDDREDVWRQGRGQLEQLLLVRPYVYFSGQNLVEANNSSGPLSSIGTAAGAPSGAAMSPVILLGGPQPGRVAGMAPAPSPEYSEQDDQLVRCLELLRTMHQLIYPSPALSATEAGPSPATAPAPAPAPVVNRSVATLQALVQGKSISSVSGKEKAGRDRERHSLSLRTRNTRVPPPSRTEEASLLTVPLALTSMKAAVLAGCTLAFSGVIPTNETNPRTHLLWKLAESLGAQVSLDLLPRTTHLIAVNLHTQKVSEVLSRGDVWVLHPDWLFYCRWSLARACETTFMINALPKGASLPRPLMNNIPLTPTVQVRPDTSPPQAPLTASSSAIDEGEEEKRQLGVEIQRIVDSNEQYILESGEAEREQIKPMKRKRDRLEDDSEDENGREEGEIIEEEESEGGGDEADRLTAHRNGDKWWEQQFTEGDSELNYFKHDQEERESFGGRCEEDEDRPEGSSKNHSESEEDSDDFSDFECLILERNGRACS